MANDSVGELLNEVGNVLASDTAYPLDGTILYAEAASMMVDISIFKDLGDRLLFRWPMDGLSDVLLELWEAAPPHRRSTGILYRIGGGKFDASFTYPEEIDPHETTLNRRTRILQLHFGNKRIDYPSLP